MEIDSITVPQDLVEDELEPTLLLYVNSESSKGKLSNKNKLESSINSDCPKTNKTSLNKGSENEIAQRKAVTKALRSIKKKSYPLVDKTSELCISNLNQDDSKNECVVTTDNSPNYSNGCQHPCFR